MKYPNKTTMWVDKSIRDRYSKYGVKGESFNDVLRRIADEHDLAFRELLRLREKLKKLKK